MLSSGVAFVLSSLPGALSSVFVVVFFSVLMSARASVLSVVRASNATNAGE